MTTERLTHVENILERWQGTLSRRTFLEGSGLLVVGLGAAAVAGPLSPV